MKILVTWLLLAVTPAALALPNTFWFEEHTTADSPTFSAKTPSGFWNFLSHGPEITLSDGQRLSWRFNQAQTPIIHGKLPHSTHLQKITTKGSVSIPNWHQLVYSQVWPGIDLLFYWKNGQIAHDWLVAPQANPQNIRWSITGAHGKLTNTGTIALQTKNGNWTLQAPHSWQQHPDKRIPSSFITEPLENGLQIAFQLTHYNPALPLVIDPMVVFSSFIGGTGNDDIRRLLSHPSGTIFILGNTFSADFPVTPEALNVTLSDHDVFVAQLTADGSATEWVTYIGGSSIDVAQDMVMDDNHLYLTGRTESSDFPVTNNSNLNGNSDAFLLKLSLNGQTVHYASFLGGSSHQDLDNDTVDMEGAYAIAVNGSHLVIAGTTRSEDFPVTANAQQPQWAGDYDGFIARWDNTDNNESLEYASYLGGSLDDSLRAVTLTDQLIILAGESNSTDFPVTNAQTHHDNSAPGAFDITLTHLDLTNGQIQMAHYIGGQGNDTPTTLVLDKDGNTLIGGTTQSRDFPVSDNAIQSQHGGASDAFILRFTQTSGEQNYGSFLGGNDHDSLQSIAVTENNHLYLAGYTRSKDFPVNHPLQTSHQGSLDGFLLKLENLQLTYGTLYGGSSNDLIYSVAAENSSQDALIAGSSASSELGIQPALQSELAGLLDGFITRIASTDSDLSISMSSSPNPVSVNSTLTYHITASNLGNTAVRHGLVQFDYNANSRLIAATPTQGLCHQSFRRLTCQLDTLLPISESEAATITINVEPQAEGYITATAAVRALSSDPNPTNNQVSQLTETLFVSTLGSDSAGHCFIATAATGYYDAPMVQILRQFRDRILLPNRLGQWLVGHYYSYSPPLAQKIADSAIWRTLTLIGLLPWVFWSAFILALTSNWGILPIGLICLLVFRRQLNNASNTCS